MPATSSSSSSVAPATDATDDTDTARDKSTSSGGQILTSRESVESNPSEVIPWYGWLAIGIGVLAVLLVVVLVVTAVFFSIKCCRHRSQRGLCGGWCFLFFASVFLIN